MELSLLNLLLVLVAAWIAGNLAARFGYPSVLGELLAGILLGPPLLGILHGSEAISILADVGVLLMMLYIGMEVNPRDLKKVSWAGGLAAIGGFITPFMMAYAVVLWFGGTHLAGLFVGIAAGITSLATKSRILVDLKLLDTRIAHVMMAGALISDTLSLIIFAGILGVAQSGMIDFIELGIVAAKAAAFFGVTVLIGLKLFPYVGKRLSEAGYTGPTFTFTLVLIIAVLFGELAELAGLHSILGAFIAGLFIQENVLGRTLSNVLTNAVREASIGFLAPIFFVMVGFEVTFDVFQTDLGLFLSILGVATVGKVLGTALFYLPTGYGWREGLAIGAGMNGRGAVEIIVAGIGLEMGLITQEIFSVLVFMAIFTTAAVPLFLKWGTDWLRRRNELVRAETERQGVLIIGAGPLAQQLATLLSGSQPVWLVDANATHCSVARERGLISVCGNALQENVISDAHAAQASTVITMTSNAEVNVLAAQLSKDVFQVPEIIVLQTTSEGEGREASLARLDASVLFGGPVLPRIWDHWILQNEIRLDTMQSSDLVSRTSVDIHRHLVSEENRLPLAVLSGDRIEPFHSESKLGSGDALYVLDREAVPERPIRADRFGELARECPILDLGPEIATSELFAKVGQAFADLGITTDPAEVIEKAFHEQAVDFSSVVAPGLAVPHAVVGGRGVFAMIAARSRSGIRFSAEDEPVHALFLLVRSEDERRQHLRVLAAIAQLVQHPAFEERWLEAEGEQELRKIMVETRTKMFEEMTARR